MTKTYGAINPQQIIDLFEMRAKISEQGAQREKITMFEQGKLNSEAITWREAADIIRNTEFVGWDRDSRIVQELPVVLDVDPIDGETFDEYQKRTGRTVWTKPGANHR